MTEKPDHTAEKERSSGAMLRPERGRGRGVAVIALILLAFSTICSGVMLGMQLEGIQRSAAGDGTLDAKRFAEDAKDAMGWNLTGMGAGLIGGALAAWTLYGVGNREEWFLWSGLVATLFQFVTFPFGPFIGIILVVGWVIRWREFRPRRRPAKPDKESSC